MLVQCRAESCVLTLGCVQGGLLLVLCSVGNVCLCSAVCRGVSYVLVLWRVGAGAQQGRELCAGAVQLGGLCAGAVSGESCVDADHMKLAGMDLNCAERRQQFAAAILLWKLLQDAGLHCMWQ